MASNHESEIKYIGGPVGSQTPTRSVQTISAIAITTGPINKMFLQLTVKNQEHQKFKQQDALPTSLRKKSKKQSFRSIQLIDIFYCLFIYLQLRIFQRKHPIVKEHLYYTIANVFINYFIYYFLFFPF